MIVYQTLVKMVELVKTKRTTTHAPVPQDIQERVVKLVSIFVCKPSFIMNTKFLNLIPVKINV